MTRISWAFSLLVAIVSSAAQSQQPGTHGPNWGFAVASAASKDVRHPRLTRIWNPIENLDSVWIVMGRSHTAPIDSIRISVRSGPSRLASERNPLAATYRSDSLGQWLTAPTTLLRPGTGERNVPMPMRVLGVFSPSAIVSWARSQNPKHPVVTRVAADVWRHKTYERTELYLESPAVDAKSTVASQQRKLNAAKPGRK